MLIIYKPSITEQDFKKIISLMLHLSSKRKRSSSSWILFSSWETPAEERDWPSISATRLLSSFSW